MFFPGTPILFVPGNSVFMLLKCMCYNISIEKKENSKSFDDLSQNVSDQKSTKEKNKNCFC